MYTAPGTMGIIRAKGENVMKKYIAFFLGLLLLLTAGCGKRPAEETTETTQPVPTETVETETLPSPKTVNGVILADDTSAILTFLSRGDSVDVVGTYDETRNVVRTESGYGLVEKRLLSAGENAYDAWTGYAYWNRNVYDNYHLSGTPALVLDTNTEVRVLDDLEGCLVVQVGDFLGFLNAEDLSKSPIRTPSEDSGTGSGDPGGGSGGTGEGRDGGDIRLGVYSGLVPLAAIRQEGTVTRQALVKADGTEAVLGFFNRGGIVPIVAEPGAAEERKGYCTVWIDGLYAYIPENLIRPEGEQGYSEWDGFAKYGAGLYGDFYLQKNEKSLSVNAEIHVLEDLRTCYYVRVGEDFGYMEKSLVSREKIQVSIPDDSAGGQGTGGESYSGQEWSDPIL